MIVRREVVDIRRALRLVKALQTPPHADRIVRRIRNADGAARRRVEEHRSAARIRECPADQKPRQHALLRPNHEHALLCRPRQLRGEAAPQCLPVRRIVPDPDAPARRGICRGEEHVRCGRFRRGHSVLGRTHGDPFHLRRIVPRRQLHERDALRPVRAQPRCIRRRQSVQERGGDELFLPQGGQRLLHPADDVAERPARREFIVDKDDGICARERRLHRLGGDPLLGRMAVLLQKFDPAPAPRLLPRRLDVGAGGIQFLRDDAADRGRRLGKADDQTRRGIRRRDPSAECRHHGKCRVRGNGHVLSLQGVDEQIGAFLIVVPLRHTQHRVRRIVHPCPPHPSSSCGVSRFATRRTQLRSGYAHGFSVPTSRLTAMSGTLIPAARQDSCSPPDIRGLISSR